MENRDDLTSLEFLEGMASTPLGGILSKKQKKGLERFPTATALHDRHCNKDGIKHRMTT